MRELFALICDVVAENACPSSVRLEHPKQNIYQRRLACAVGPEKSENFSFLDVERNVFQSVEFLLLLLENFANIFYPNNFFNSFFNRSEERRVGKECRS